MSKASVVRHSLQLAVVVALVAVVALYIHGAAQARPALLGPFPPETDVYVDGSNTSGEEDGTQAHPYNTIQEGVDAASDGNTVGVAPGTYVEEVTMETGVSLIGANRDTTIIDGSGDNGDVVSIVSESTLVTISNVRVSGFTIRGALSGGGLPGGAGIFVNIPGGNIKIDDNIITGNDFGVAVFNAFHGSGGPDVDANLIIGNNYDGIHDPGDGPITNNVIAENGTGIGKGGNSKASIIVNNTIVNNVKEGINIWDDSVSAISNNIISGNGEFGIDVRTANNPSAKRPLVTANLFFNNTSGNFSDINSPVGNDATFDTEAEINSISENSNNLVGAPQLVSPSGGADGDYHLNVGSPAVDAGTDTDSPPLTDFEGDPRPIDGDGDEDALFDIGADEFIPSLLHYCNGQQVTIVGTAGDDKIEGTPHGDVIAGLDGDDEIDGHGGDDVICGGPGNDTVHGGEGNDLVDGGQGNDTLHGDSGHDDIYGGPGKDLIHGHDGDDRLFGGKGNDIIHGHRGHDDIKGDLGKDVLYGDDGDDRLEGGKGNDTLHGNNGQDHLIGGAGKDNLHGDRGHDELVGGLGNDVIHGGNGDDNLRGGAGNDDLNGGNGRDVLDGGEGADELHGGRDNDDLIGGSGNDNLHGGRGDDNLESSSGDNTLHGGRGFDNLVGGTGADEINGGRGDDNLEGHAGDDNLSGGRGNDNLDGGPGTDELDCGPGVDYHTSGEIITNCD